MPLPQLVLSNTTTFFSGRLEAVFKKAKKYGFRYLEILPYRWTTPAEVLRLEKKYGVEVAGIHLPIWWQAPPPTLTRGLFGRFFTLVCKFYMGDGATSPAIAIAESLADRSPYLVVHADLIPAMGGRFPTLAQKLHVVVENVPDDTDIAALRQIAPVVFDPAHYGARAELSETYRQTAPEIFHISYDHGFFFHHGHGLPDPAEQALLRQLLRLHSPRYLVLETYPWVSVKRGKKLLEEIIN